MSRLEAFLEACDAVVEVDPAELVHEAGADAANRAMMPLIEMRAERAGVTLEELRASIGCRIDLTINVIVARLLTGADVVTQLHLLGRSAAVHHFLLGALWEQQRHMPDPNSGASG